MTAISVLQFAKRLGVNTVSAIAQKEGRKWPPPPTISVRDLASTISQVDRLAAMYGSLRAYILSRHFALGRHFRADHLSFYNNLGVVHQDGSVTDDQKNDLAVGCMYSGATIQQPTRYANAAELLNLSDSDGLFERWRVADHARENPLMYSGQLMTCLAVECMLGIPGSKEVLRRLLGTIKSLFKFNQEPYKGYILRWDPVTSDRWTTVQNGELLDHCCDFLTDSDRAGGYLYCTPLNDPRYTPYISDSAFQKLSDIEKRNYNNARKATILTYYRAWEPSMDELVGLVAGYDFVYRVVSDPDVAGEVKSQVQQLGTYLAANAYLLVRPEGGFSARGASGVLPAFEFPFGRVFSRITGSDFSAQTDFEGALKNAGVWSYFSDAFALATVAGWPISFVTDALLGALGPLFGPFISTLIELVGGVDAAKALAVLQCSGSLDVGSFPGDGSTTYPGNRGEQTEFALAYLLVQVPRNLRFTTCLSAIARFGKFTPANHLPPFIGLTGVGDTDPTVRNAYLDWLSARRAKNDPPTDDGQDDLVPNNDAFASAVAVLLGAGSAEESKLVSLLEGLRKEFEDEEKRKGELALIDSGDQVDGSKFVQEPIRPAMNFLSAVALAWYYSATQSAADSPIPASIGFPNPPPRGSTLPTPSVPEAVIKMTSKYSGGTTPEQVIALAGLPPLGSPPWDEVDLFSNAAPVKPSDPPPPMSTVRWLYTGATSFSGNILGSSGTEVINSGKRVGGSACTILGVKLELVNEHGERLVGPSTTTTLGRPDAVDGSEPFTASARIVAWSSLNGAWMDGTNTNELSHGTTNDETVTVQWRYSSGRACRFRLGYLVQGTNCSL